MNKDKMVEWLSGGNVSIPKYLINHYAELGLTEEEFMLILHVYTFIESGNSFPTPSELSAKMSVSTEKCTNVLRYLLKKGFIGIKEEFDVNHILYEKYTLEPLWEKIATLFLTQQMKEEKEKEEREEENLYTIFEQEFGRPLSPFECESLGMWIDQDHHDPIIIKAALREAVLSGKLNFRYIDRILFDWKKKGIKTIEQAQMHGKKFRQHQLAQKNQGKETGEYRRTVPFFNWLEEN